MGYIWDTYGIYMGYIYGIYGSNHQTKYPNDRMTENMEKYGNIIGIAKILQKSYLNAGKDAPGLLFNGRKRESTKLVVPAVVFCFIKLNSAQKLAFSQHVLTSCN